MDPELLKRLDALAEKVGQTGERLFASLVRQEVVAGWTWLIVGAALTMTFVGFGLVLRAWAGEEAAQNPKDSDAGSGLLAGAMGMWLIAAIFLFTMVPCNTIRLASPEAAALKTLLGK